MNNDITTGYRKSLLVIAVPIMLNMLITQLQILIDRIFLGQINVSYMSALGNVMAPMWASISVLFALTTGSTILISHAIGAGEIEKARDMTGSMFKYNNILAFMIFAFWALFARKVYTLMGVRGEVLEYCVDYTVFFLPIIPLTGIGASSAALLQTNGYTRPILVSGIVRSGLNVLLDWLLIYGKFGFPEMGLQGGALATTIAETTGGILLIVMIIKTGRLKTRPSFNGIIKARLAPYLASVKMGIPSAAEELLWNLGNLAIIRLLNMIDTQAAGVFTIIFSVEILPSILFIAIGQATMTITGQKTGARDSVLAKKIGRTALFWCWGLALASLFVFAAIPGPILRLFTSDSAIVSSAMIYLLIVGIDLFPRSANIILGSGIRGYGDTRWMMITQAFGTVFVAAVAACFIFVFRLGIIGVFYAIIVDETLRCLINYTRFRLGPKFEKLSVVRGEGVNAEKEIAVNGEY